MFHNSSFPRQEGKLTVELWGFLKLHMVIAAESDCMSGKPLLLEPMTSWAYRMGSWDRILGPMLLWGQDLSQDPFISL